MQIHSLVLQFIEEHKGKRKKYLMRTTNYLQKALERQVLISLRIEEGAKVPGESLNQKSEWAMSKLPNIQLRKVKGGQVVKKKKKRI